MSRLIKSFTYENYGDCNGLTFDDKGNYILSSTFKNIIFIFTPNGDFIKKIKFLDLTLTHNKTLIFYENTYSLLKYIDREIIIFDKNGNIITSFGKKIINKPLAMTRDYKGNYLVADGNNHEIQVFNSKGCFLYSFGEFGINNGKFRYPSGITCDLFGNYVILDKGNHRIQIFNSEGNFITSFGKYGSSNGQFRYPGAIMCDNDGNFVIADNGNHRIQIFSKEGDFICILDENIESSTIMCDFLGNYVIIDEENCEIKFYKRIGIPSLLTMCWQVINFYQI